MGDMNAVVERTYQLLRQLLGDDMVDPPNERRAWFFRRGSVTVLVSVTTRGDSDEPVVGVASPVVEGVENSPELLDALNTMNYSMYFAHAYWRDGIVWVTTNLVGETLDLPELEKALSVVGEWSDGVDEAFIQRFGSAQAQGVPPPPPGYIART